MKRTALDSHLLNARNFFQPACSITQLTQAPWHHCCMDENENSSETASLVSEFRRRSKPCGGLQMSDVHSGANRVSLRTYGAKILAAPVVSLRCARRL